MFKQFRDLERGEPIIVGGDGAAGGPECNCCQFLSQKKIDVPLVYHSSGLMTEMINDIYPVLNEIYDITKIKPVVALERNNGGVFEIERLASLNRGGKFEIFIMPEGAGKLLHDETARQRRMGWDTNTATRPNMLRDLKEATDKRLIRIYDIDTIRELFSFIVSQTSSAWKAQHEKGAKDDRVLSLAIAWQVYQKAPALQTRSKQYAEQRRRTYTLNPETA